MYDHLPSPVGSLPVSCIVPVIAPNVSVAVPPGWYLLYFSFWLWEVETLRLSQALQFKREANLSLLLNRLQFHPISCQQPISTSFSISHSRPLSCFIFFSVVIPKLSIFSLVMRMQFISFCDIVCPHGFSSYRNVGGSFFVLYLMACMFFLYCFSCFECLISFCWIHLVFFEYFVLISYNNILVHLMTDNGLIEKCSFLFFLR